MDFLYKIATACFTHQALETEEPDESGEMAKGGRCYYKSAGCFFTDGRYVLAGYQQNKTTPRISGIGGAKQDGESPADTAIRETIEELFNIDYIPTIVLTDIKINLPPQNVFKNHSYRLITYTFTDLDQLLKILNKHQMKSPLYNTFPTNFQELLFTRKIDKNSEISHLALLPFVDHAKHSSFVCPLLLSDMSLLIKK
jgi:hypothetical protein